METASAPLALVMRIRLSPLDSPQYNDFNVSFDVSSNKRLYVQTSRRWFETSGCSLWRHCNEKKTSIIGFTYIPPNINVTEFNTDIGHLLHKIGQGEYCTLIDGRLKYQSVNILRPRQNGRRLAEDNFKRILFNENVLISIYFSLKLVIYPYPGPVYTGMPLKCHWLAQCTLRYHWANQRILVGYTRTPLEKLSWNCPTLECHWRNSDYCSLHRNTAGGTVKAHTPHAHIVISKVAPMPVWNDNMAGRQAASRQVCVNSVLRGVYCFPIHTSSALQTCEYFNLILCMPWIWTQL